MNRKCSGLIPYGTAVKCAYEQVNIKWPEVRVSCSSVTTASSVCYLCMLRMHEHTMNISVMWSETVGLSARPIWDQKIGLDLGLAGLVLFCETRSCHARRHNDLKGQSNFSSTIYSFSILYLEHHYCGDQQWRSLTEKLNPLSAFVYFRWSWSCYFDLGLKSFVLFWNIFTVGH